MSLKGLTALLHAGHLLEILVYEGNLLFIEQLRHLYLSFPEQVSLKTETYHTRPLQISWTWLRLTHAWRLSQKIRRCRAQRLLILQGDIEQCSEGVLAGWLSGVETISYIPMVMSGRERGIRLSWLRDILSFPIYRLADRFIVISDYFRHRIEAISSADVRVVFNSIDLEFFHASTARAVMRNHLGIRENEFVSGFVGRLAYQQKGLDRLIETLKIGRKHFLRNRLLVVGDGPDRERFTNDLKAYGLTDCVILCPWTAEGRYRLFDAMDLFLCVSRFEGLPLTLLEAMARGTPILSVPLAPLVGTLPVDFVGNVNRPFDPTEFAHAISQHHSPSYSQKNFERSIFLKQISHEIFQKRFVDAVTG